MKKFKDIVLDYSEKLDRDLNFLQLGCNDGFMADPLCELIISNKWKGVFVDADSFYLNRAMDLYVRADRDMCESMSWSFINAGIVTELEKKESATPFKKFFSIVPSAIRPTRISFDDNGSTVAYGDKVFYIQGMLEYMDPVRNNQLDYLQGIGSFDYNFVLDHILRVTKKQDPSGMIARKVFTENREEHSKFVQMQFVPQQSVNDIMEAYPFPSIDLLQTDLEHWDVKVLADLESFSKKPNLIHFEAANGVDDSLRDVFKRCGYDLIKTDRDHMAILQNDLEE